jgi:hypothetical protein
MLTAVLFAAGFPSQTAALVIGQTNTFQDLTTDGWFAGGLGPPGQHPPVPPQVVANGGPGGAGDAFLQITGTGALNAPGGRVVAIGGTQWAGNYSALAPVAIAMDLRNLGQNPLTVRLLLEDPQGAPPSDEGVTTLGISLPVGGPWQHAQFLINPGALTMLGGNPNALLANTTLLRIIHSPTAADAVDVAGVLGVDNITLVRPAQVPIPGTLPLLAAGLALLVRFTRAHRTKDAAD